MSLTSCLAWAQTQRSLTLLPDSVQTDSLILMAEGNESDLAIAFTFDQAQNILTVNLQSEQQLFVFRHETQYGNIIKRATMGLGTRQLNPFKLTYPVVSPDKAKYRVSLSIKHQLSPRGKRITHLFPSWVEVRGAQPIKAKYAMVSDTVMQQFKVDPSVSQLSLTLHDVMTIAKDPDRPSKPNRFVIDNRRDFNIQYQITLKRDPCFGMEAQQAQADTLYHTLAEALHSLHEAYPTGEAKTVETLDEFHTTRNSLLLKYTFHNDSTIVCPDLKETWDNYNQLVTQLMNLKCTLSADVLKLAGSAEYVDAIDGRVHNLDLTAIMFKARQIDQLVAMWKMSTDRKQRIAIVQQCDRIVREAEDLCVGRIAYNDQQKAAIETIRKAIDYFNKTCK